MLSDFEKVILATLLAEFEDRRDRAKQCYLESDSPTQTAFHNGAAEAFSDSVILMNSTIDMLNKNESEKIRVSMPSTVGIDPCGAEIKITILKGVNVIQTGDGKITLEGGPGIISGEIDRTINKQKKEPLMGTDILGGAST